jgi:hypothetical protein
MALGTPDRTNSRVWLMLVIVGAILGVIGWYQYVS